MVFWELEYLRPMNAEKASDRITDPFLIGVTWAGFIRPNNILDSTDQGRLSSIIRGYFLPVDLSVFFFVNYAKLAIN